VLEDDVFCGPHAVFTNVRYPRAGVSQRSSYERTTVKCGVTIGANSTIRCGVTLGEYSFVAAGAVITRDTEPYALVAGLPGRPVGWVSRRGRPLHFDAERRAQCRESGEWYRLDASGRVEPELHT
jgi:UDP-2-acetamido-3-amino-2,3-dideoxy-glucuronate N-acetyltransferase